MSDDFAIELEDLFVTRNMIRDYNVKEFNDLSSERVISEMGFGWNLGNTLDAYFDEQNQGLSSETSWGNPYTTLAMIKELARKGVKSIRLPITWHNHLIDENYTIDPEWMRRVKEIVDWCIDNDLYVIIDTAHDNTAQTNGKLKYGVGYYLSIKDAEESERFLYNIWRQITFAFNKGYDHHLIFEALSVPRLIGTLFEWNFDRRDDSCLEAASVIQEYNALILYTIRESGGNNAKRFVLFAPYAASINSLYESGFEFPDDSTYNPRSNRLLLSLHYYTPSTFTQTDDLDFAKFEDSYKAQITEQFQGLYENFVRKGYYVVLTEIGTINKENTQERVHWADFIIREARNNHLATLVWDNGVFQNGEKYADTYGLFHRKELKWDKEGLINTLVMRSQIPFRYDPDAFHIIPKQYFDKSKAVVDKGQVSFNDKVTAEQISEAVGMGWNLGDTLDSHVDKNEFVLDIGLKAETLWKNPVTTEEMIAAVAAKGIHTLRLPVSWHNHLIDADYTINPEWMERVKTIVNWGLKYGLYVILNCHHDNHFFFEKRLEYGQGYYPTYRDIAESERYIYNLWSQIALAFNNGYDHHLIFEGLNEPRLAGFIYEWFYQKGDQFSEEAVVIINEFMRLIVKAIRESGGNNEKRFIMVTPYAAQYTSAMNTVFIFPDDTLYNPRNQKIILSVHMYFPYPFALGYSWADRTFGEEGKAELYEDFKNLYNKFIKNGRQIIIGEMGSLNKKNTEDRLEWALYYTSTARKFHMSSCVWDNNIYKDDEATPGENLGEFHRQTLTWTNEDMIGNYLKGSKTEFMENPE